MIAVTSQWPLFYLPDSAKWSDYYKIGLVNPLLMKGISSMQNPGCLIPFLPLALIAGLLGLLVIPVQIETAPDIIATVGPLFKTSQSGVTMMEQLEEAEALWKTHAVGSYTITAYNGRPLSSLEPTISVIDGEVAESSAVCWLYTMSKRDCVPPPFDPETYTVPGLFDMVRDVLKYSDAAFIKQLEFDPTYGYLIQINYDDPQIGNDEWWITVEQFEVN
jgi:hypothetical protein